MELEVIVFMEIKFLYYQRLFFTLRKHIAVYKAKEKKIVNIGSQEYFSCAF